MTTSTGMNVLLMQTLAHRGFAAPVAIAPEPEEDEVPNARVRATLDRVLAGTEPTYGPFASVEEMLDAARSQEGSEPIQTCLGNRDSAIR